MGRSAHKDVSLSRSSLMDLTREWRAQLCSQVYLPCCSTSGLDGGLFISTEGTAGVCSQPHVSYLAEWRGCQSETACSQQEGHLPCWETLHDSTPDLFEVFQFGNLKDLTLNSELLQLFVMLLNHLLSMNALLQYTVAYRWLFKNLALCRKPTVGYIL